MGRSRWTASERAAGGAPRSEGGPGRMPRVVPLMLLGTEDGQWHHRTPCSEWDVRTRFITWCTNSAGCPCCWGLTIVQVSRDLARATAQDDAVDPDVVALRLPWSPLGSGLGCREPSRRVPRAHRRRRTPGTSGRPLPLLPRHGGRCQLRAGRAHRRILVRSATTSRRQRGPCVPLRARFWLPSPSLRRRRPGARWPDRRCRRSPGSHRRRREAERSPVAANRALPNCCSDASVQSPFGGANPFTMISRRSSTLRCALGGEPLGDLAGDGALPCTGWTARATPASRQLT